MSTKEIFGFLNVVLTRDKLHQRGSDQPVIQEGNVFFKAVTRRRTITFWDTNNSGSPPQIKMQPWKMAFLLSDDDDTVGHSHIGVAARFTVYGVDPPTPAIGTLDYKKFRATGTTTTITAATKPLVVGSVGAFDALDGSIWQKDNGLISLNDVPLEYTQIGTVYQHPIIAQATGGDISTTIGTDYVSFINTHYLDSIKSESHIHNLLRILTGVDAGLYFIRYVDLTNNRLHLMNLNGTAFSGQATASSLTWSTTGYRAFFNVVGLIQFSTGVVSTGGTFRPGAARNSFILRVIFDKSGSDETAAAGEQQGSYYITMKPYTHGEGLYAEATQAAQGLDVGRLGDNALMTTASPGINFPTNWTFFGGGTNGLALDETNQRVWFGYTNPSNQSGIGYWRWKTIENAREISSHLGTAAHKTFVTPSINLAAGDVIRGLRIGPAGTVYIGIWHASAGNGGIAIIKPNLTTLQYITGAAGFPTTGHQMAAIELDSSRARVGTPTDTSTNGADQITSASGAFTASDIGRVIQLTGLGADNGTFKIATIVGATQVTVQTLAGGAVTFTIKAGGTFEIGERLYLFYRNATTGAGKINYMESLALGTFFTRTVSMTNGANCTVQDKNGENCKATIDPVTGDIYWLSDDTQYQINKYTVLTNTHSFRTIANVQTPTGGTGTIGTITLFSSIMLNPKFDEIWVGTDQGHVKIVKSDFAGANNKRYYGDENTTYANPTGIFRPQGETSTIGVTRRVRNYWVQPDGKMWVSLNDAGTGRDILACYSRESDCWNFKEDWIYEVTTTVGNNVFDSIGNFFYVHPGASGGFGAAPSIAFGSAEIQYQWDNTNTRWIPLEVSQGALPNKSPSDTISPGCIARPIHSTLENVLYGVKIRFTKQGGATPSNNEFLGRVGLSHITATDGATVAATAGFVGSGFVSGDVGRFLRIESGVDAGVYLVSVFNSSTSLTLKKLNGAAFSAGATAGSLSYTLWSQGTVGSNAGPENATVLLADGFSKDNTQDITGIQYDTYHFKTLMQENVEGVKFCVQNPIGVPGAVSGMKVYYDFFPRVGTAILSSHDLQTTHARALPASEWTVGGFDGSKLVDGFVDGLMDGTSGTTPNSNRGMMDSSPSNQSIWYGVNAVAGGLGCCPMVDIGADAEVGYILLRGRTKSTMNLGTTLTNHGLRATLYKANNAGGTPVASSVSSASGTTNLSLTVNDTTITTSGDFLGPVFLASASNGSVTAGGNTLTAPAATFSTVAPGMVLKITSVGDVGSYRILTIDGTGAILTVRALNQTAVQWSGSVSNIVYEIRDGVREEDVLCIPSIGAPTQRLCIERVLTPTTAQVRIAPHTTAATQSWQCAVPTWDKVKRLSFSTEALPPEVKNNGTWLSEDGREQYDPQDFKIYMDLTDLTVAQRTGRWWQMQMMPRFAGNASSGDFFLCGFEFYSPSGARLGVSQHTFSNNSIQNADFLSQHINRFDFIQSSDAAMTGVAGFNGNVGVAGTDGNTLTLTAGGNQFLGFQVRRPYTDGVSTVGIGGNFSSATAVFLAADVGRFLRVTTGADAGIYRIASRVSATAITVTTINGAAVTFAGDTGRTFSIHEGISAGGVSPDRIVLTADMSREYTIATISDNLQTITIAESAQAVMINKAWEIRRPAFDTSSGSVDSTKLARLVRPEVTYPLQRGDVTHDSRGALRFFSEDIGTGNSRSDGSITGGNGVFVGTGFCSDDVGRLLYITTGVTANQGVWRISVFTSATSITVVNAYTGAAVVFTADAVADKVYKIFGDRRFKITKQVTTLRA